MGDLGDLVPGYQLIERAGQGGFAVVYRARHERLGRVVAVKILSVTHVGERVLRGFARELELTSRLSDHPNIVAALDTGTTADGRPYIVMDFYEGGSLSDHLRAMGALPLDEALRIGVKIGAALDAVHQAGVYHGDIKPQNILMSKYGEPALADFGVARMLDVGQLSSNTLALTPHHAAPEVLNGSPQSVASDLYALGSTLYQLLSGRPPFYDPADAGVAPLLLRVLQHPPPPLQRPDVPPAVAHLVERAMSKDPGARPQSAVEFSRKLQGVQRALGMPVTELTTLKPAPTRATVPPAAGPPAAVPPAAGLPDTAPPAAVAPGTGPSGTVPPTLGGAARPVGQSQPGPTVSGITPGHRPRRRLLTVAAVTTVVLAATATAVFVTTRPSDSVSAATSPTYAQASPTGAASASPAPTTTRPGKPTLAKVSVATDTRTPAQGQSLQLTLKGRLSNGRAADLTGAAVQYHSADPKIATVSPDGHVTALGPGSVRITVKVTVGDASRTAALTLSVGSRTSPTPTPTTHGGPKNLRIPAMLSNYVEGGGSSREVFAACDVCKIKSAPRFYYETYLRFDLAKAKVDPSKIRSISLNMWMWLNDKGGIDEEVSAYSVGNGWTSKVTFETRPQLGAKLLEFPSVDHKGRWVKVDLTNYFKPKLGGPASVGLSDAEHGWGVRIGGISHQKAPYLEIITR